MGRTSDISLGWWQPPNSDGSFGRVYVNGLPGLPAGSKAWVQPKGRGVSVRFSGDAGPHDEASVLDALSRTTGAREITWDAVSEAARAAPPKRRGFAPGSTAASRSPGATRPDWEANLRPWTAADVEATSIDMAAQPFPEPTTLVVDHREPAEMVDLLRGVSNLVVEVAALEVGDYVAPGRLVLERKTATDLVNSVTEDAKRVFSQSDRMARSDEVARVLLIEGDFYGNQRMKLPQIAGLISYLAVVQGLSVIPTLSLRHSAMMVAKLTRHAVHGLGYDLGLRATGPREPTAAAIHVLEGVPGVSATRARALLARFGSLAAVAVAEEKALRGIEGIGPATAKLIVETFRAGHA